MPILHVENGLNPLGTSTCVSNSVHMNTVSRVCILTGVNGSGKTYFMKMLALNVVLAHIGAHVPCDMMILSPMKHLFL